MKREDLKTECRRKGVCVYVWGNGNTHDMEAEAGLWEADRVPARWAVEWGVE